MAQAHTFSVARPTFQLFLGLAAVALGVSGAVLSDIEVPDFTYPAPDDYAHHEPLYAYRTIGQTVVAAADNLSAIGFQLSPYTRRQPSGRILLHVRSSLNETTDIRRSSIPAEVVRKDREERFTFEPIRDSRGKPYALLLDFPQVLSDRAVGVRFDNAENRDYADGERSIDGEPAGGDLAFTLYHKARPTTALQLFGGIIAVGLALIFGVLPVLPRGTPAQRFAAVLLVALPILALIPALKHLQAFHPESARTLAAVVADTLWQQGSVSRALLSALSFLVAGGAGMYAFLKQQRLSALAALVGASVFSLSSAFSLRIAAGDATIGALAFLPWILLFHKEAQTDRRAFVPAVLSFALLAFLGGTERTLHTAVFVMVLTTLLSLRRRALRPLLLMSAVVLLGGTLGMISAPQSPGDVVSKTSASGIPVTVSALKDIFLDPLQVGNAEKFPGQSLPWLEYGTSVGAFAVLLMLAALLKNFRESVPWALTGLAMLFLSFLTSAAVASFGVLPIALTAHPHQLLVTVLFVIAVLAAHGFDAVRAAVRTHTLKETAATRALHEIAVALFAATVIGNILLVNATAYPSPANVPPSEWQIFGLGHPAEATPVMLGVILSGMALLALWTRMARWVRIRASS